MEKKRILGPTLPGNCRSWLVSRCQQGSQPSFMDSPPNSKQNHCLSCVGCSVRGWCNSCVHLRVHLELWT